MSAPQRLWVHRDGEAVLVEGRNAWALVKLIDAGTKGVTPVTEPAGPRWSAYIFNLRRQGFSIETVHETHDGPYPGRHGRYVLRSQGALTEGADAA